jgi:hypothetical protein
VTLVVRLFGVTVLEVSTDDAAAADKGDCVTTPVGFVASPRDPRWQPGLEP